MLRGGLTAISTYISGGLLRSYRVPAAVKNLSVAYNESAHKRHNHKWGETMAAVAAQSNEDLGKLVVRLTVGILIVFHGLALATGDAGIPNNLIRWGLPPGSWWNSAVVWR
jgi:hypothetical protein